MNKQRDWKGLLFSLICVVLGNFLYALTVQLFLIPSGLLTGGTTGIALIANHFWGLPVSGFVLFFNVVMLWAGVVFLGKQFAVTTLASTFLYPVFLEIVGRVLDGYVMTRDMLLCTIFFGLGVGVSLGIVIRSGASTGGMDIPPLVLQKLFKVPVSVSLYVFDVCILLGQAVFRPTENVLYGIILVMIYTVVLDKLLLMGTTRIEIKVVSEKNDMIRKAILEQVDRGVTMLDGAGGYMGMETRIVFSVISNRELPKVEKLIRTIDPECFMVVSRVKEVSGRGFSMKKRYK